MGRSISDLPNALAAKAGLQKAMGGRRPAVFLDYDGVLTPIVDHPEDARISAAMGDVVRGLARRTTVCVVSGRDRPADYALASVGEVERFLDRLAR